MTFLWNLLESNTPLDDHLNSKIIEALAALLVAPYYSKKIEHFITLSIKAISEKKSVESNLKIIHEAMKICKGQKMYRAIESIEKELPIVDTVVKAVVESENISVKAAESMFEFLEEVNHVARKGVNMSHIKTFWPIKNCRSPLLKFLRQHKPSREEKSHEKIIQKRLDCETIKGLCEGIFMKPEMMDMYTKVDE